MTLRDWRKANGLTLAELADALGMGPLGDRRVQRWESGASRADADLAERIRVVTGGAVTPQDMHQTRLDWLRAQGRLGAAGPAAPAGDAAEA